MNISNVVEVLATCRSPQSLIPTGQDFRVNYRHDHGLGLLVSDLSVSCNNIIRRGVEWQRDSSL